LLTVLATIVGCSQPLAPPIRSGEPIGVQLMRAEPSFVGTSFRVLLDFESPTDLVFLSGASNAKLDSEVAHTGNSSLQIPSGSTGFTVKLSSLLPAGSFPGSWTLAGAYFISRQRAVVQVGYEAGGKVLARRSVTLEPRKWTPVLLDVSSLSDPNSAPSGEIGVLRFTFDGTPVWADDVVVFDNTKALVPESNTSGDNWSVRQRGLTILIDRRGSFTLHIPTESEDRDWNVEEANEMRVRLVTRNGKHTWTIYSDGRQYRDGKFESAVELSDPQKKALLAQQASPAEITVPEEFGRVERNAPGDKNNDGYAEQTGAYQIKAVGPRLELTITPQTRSLIRPVLEIAGLPSGRVIVNFEGKLVEKTVRLPNGHVLFELPANLDRPATVNIRVQ
jgi:hypothetical protein